MTGGIGRSWRAPRRRAQRQALAEGTLQAMILGFLQLNGRRTRWTFFQARRNTGPGRAAVPYIVLDVGGRTVYVDILSQGGGALGADRRGRQVLARRRGATCFVVRSVLDMEQVLRGLGIQLKPGGRLMEDGWPAPAHASGHTQRRKT